MQMAKNVLCSQAQIEHMTTAKSCCLNHSRQKYRGEGRLVHPKYREILQCKSLLSLLFCYKCLYFYRQDSRISCPKYSSLFVFVSSRMHAEEGLQLDERKTAASETIEIVGCDTHEKKNRKKNKERKKRKKNKRAIACAQGCLRCHVTQRFLHDRQGTNAPSSVPQRPLLAAGYSNKNQFSLSVLSPVCLRHKEASTVEERGTDKGWFSPATESETKS